MGDSPRPGRPKFKIDWKQFNTLCNIQCTLEEIAAVLDCCEDTIRRCVKEEKEVSFSVYYAKMTARARVSLRREMWHKALGPEKDGSMQKFLSKQKHLLNYADQIETNVTGWEKLAGICDELEDEKKKQLEDNKP